jgi:hypothetical protein
VSRLQRDAGAVLVTPTAEACTAPADVRLPAPGRGRKLTKRSLRTVTQTASGVVDRDVLRLECSSGDASR